MRLPCGRTVKDGYLCCKRRHHWWNTYWIKHQDGFWVLRCLFCHHVVHMSNGKMTIGNYIFKNKVLKW